MVIVGNCERVLGDYMKVSAHIVSCDLSGLSRHRNFFELLLGVQT